MWDTCKKPARKLQHFAPLVHLSIKKMGETIKNIGTQWLKSTNVGVK